MSEDKESQQPKFTVSEHTVEGETVTGKVFIIDDGDTSIKMARKIMSNKTFAAIGHIDTGKTTLTVQDIEQIKEQLPPPIPIEPMPLSIRDEQFRMSPQQARSKHQNKKQYTRKKNGKKTHRKK